MFVHRTHNMATTWVKMCVLYTNDYGSVSLTKKNTTMTK